MSKSAVSKSLGSSCRRKSGTVVVQGGFGRGFGVGFESGGGGLQGVGGVTGHGGSGFGGGGCGSCGRGRGAGSGQRFLR